MKSLFISVPKRYFYPIISSLTERVCFFIIHFSLFYKNKLIIFDNSDVKNLCNFLKDFSVFWTLEKYTCFQYLMSQVCTLLRQKHVCQRIKKINPTIIIKLTWHRKIFCMYFSRIRYDAKFEMISAKYGQNMGQSIYKQIQMHVCYFLFSYLFSFELSRHNRGSKIIFRELINRIVKNLTSRKKNKLQKDSHSYQI